MNGVVFILFQIMNCQDEKNITLQHNTIQHNKRINQRTHYTVPYFDVPQLECYT